MSNSPKARKPTEKTIELTLTIRGNYDPYSLVEDFDPDHAYGPVEYILIERDMHSARRGLDILAADAEVISDDKTEEMTAEHDRIDYRAGYREATADIIAIKSLLMDNRPLEALHVAVEAEERYNKDREGE